MSYQIPQQLQYKEKIMFGLTFKQLAYCFGFGFLDILIFKRIESLYVKLPIIVVISFIAILFMFFKLDEIIKNYKTFLFNREIKESKEKVYKFLECADVIEDKICTGKNNLAVLKVKPMNFDIKAKGDKETIIFSFQKFLNSLDFPIQILMNTERINIDTYVKSIENSNKNKKYSGLFNDYKKHLKDEISSENLLNRAFYIVIPEKTDLKVQVGICLDRLRAMNMLGWRLGNIELRKLVESMEFNSLKNNIDSLEIDEKFSRVIYASGYPRNVENGFLDKIVSSLSDFDLSLHIKPSKIDETMVSLNKELQKQKADLYAMQSRGISNPSLEIQNKDTRYILEELQKGKEKLFNIGLYVICKAKTKDELDLLTRKVESELNSLMIVPQIPSLRMLQGLKSCLPLGVDELKETRNITTEALSSFFPFTSQFLDIDNGGVWIGNNKNGIPIIKDIFNLSNPNGIVLAQSGGGKSFFSKLLITRYLLNGTKTMIIDPQGEYKGLVSHFKGQTIDLSKDSKTIINPLDLMGHDYIEKRLSLMDLMKIMLGDLSDVQRALIDKALTKTYESKGINEKKDTWDNEPPILGDLLKTLKRMRTRASRLEQTTISSIANRLEMYVTGVFSFFNKQTNLDFDNNLVSFDIGNMPSQVKPAVMFLVLDYIYMKMKSNLDKKILLIDEAWTLLSRAEEAGYIFQIVKTCRKFNLGLLLINQEVEGLLDSKAGKSVLANTSYTILMRQKPAVIDNICKTFHLSNGERTHLLTANVGEGLMLMEDEHTELKVKASDSEHKIITTNPNEKDRKDKMKPKRTRRVSIEVDEEKRFYRKSELNRHELKYLLEKKYKSARYKSLVTNKIEEFLLLPRHNESLTHLFAVYDIAEYLQKKGFRVEKYTTKKPDIVFKKGNKLCAIEVETGVAVYKKERMEEKAKSLNKNYDEWFFVVTNKNKVKAYEKYGKPLDFRYLKSTLPPLLR